MEKAKNLPVNKPIRSSLFYKINVRLRFVSPDIDIGYKRAKIPFGLSKTYA